MAKLKLCIVADLHAGDTADGTTSPPMKIQDGSKKRVFSNWSSRLSEACKIAVQHNADYFILLGDNIDSGDSDPVTTWASVCNQVEAEYAALTAGKIIAVYGNHEDSHASMEISDFIGTFVAEVDAAYRIASGNISDAWPGTVKANENICHLITLTNFVIVVTWGAGGRETIWDNTGVVYEGSYTNATAQLDWLKNTALAGVSKPVIVLCHEHLSDSDGQATISAAVLSGTPDNSHTNLQTILADVVTGGQPVTCFCGHYHRVNPNSGDIFWEKDTISGVNYYNLGPSVLGSFAKDMKGNTFFIIDIDTVLGVTAVKRFRHAKTARSRYEPYLIKPVRTRGRYNY